MRLRIENVGKIHDADIAISRLTIIAGANDAGKSTVGKTLFVASNVIKYSAPSFKQEDATGIARIFEDMAAPFTRLEREVADWLVGYLVCSLD